MPVKSGGTFLYGINLFMQAGLPVKIIILGLIIASLWSWTIIFYKSYKIKMLNKSYEKFDDLFWSGIDFNDLFQKLNGREMDIAAAIFCSIMKEWKKYGKSNMKDQSILISRSERISQFMISREVEVLDKQINFLSFVGSTGVIVGLLGTVIGVMNAMTQYQKSLASAAPAISEALFVTAIGIVVAIPASIAYSKLNSVIEIYANKLHNFSQELIVILSRRLDGS